MQALSHLRIKGGYIPADYGMWLSEKRILNQQELQGNT